METPPPLRRVRRFGVFEADLSGGLLTRQGRRVRIQTQPFQILALLLERPGEIVTREELRQQLWPNGTYVDFDGSLNAALKKLRAALNDDPVKPRFIETVPKRGYRFIAPVIKETGEKSVAHESTTGAAAPSEDATRSETRGILSQIGAWESARRIAVLFGIFLVAVAGTVAYRWQGRGRPAGGTIAAATKPIPTRQSIAVLGFRNVSGRAKDAWLSTALSEMMSTELAAGEKLRIVSGEEVANLQVSSPWPQTDTMGRFTTSRIGTALNSDLLVLGSYATVGKAGSRQLRLDGRLQDARTGEILAEVAEIGSDQNLFQLVSRIGGRMRDRLGIPPVQEAEQSGALSSLPTDPEAARLYSLGLARLRAFDALGAKDLFQQAIEIEPKFPLSHAMLFRAWARLGFDRRASDEAKKAVALSGKLSATEKMLVQGGYYETLPNPEQAISTYRTLHVMYPDSVEYGLLLVGMLNKGARREEALEVIKQLRRLASPASDDARLDIWEAKLRNYFNAPAAEALLQTGATKAQTRGQSLLYAGARLDQCAGAIWSREPQSAIPKCQEAYQIFVPAGDRVHAAAALRLIADRRADEGQRDEAIRLYEQAIGILREAAARWNLAAALNNEAILLENQGQLDRAEKAFEEVRSNFEAVGDRQNVGTANVNIADIFLEQGRLKDAEKAYRKTLQIVEPIARNDSAYPNYRLAYLYLLEGRVDEARQEAGQAIDKLCGIQSDPKGLAEATDILGDICYTQADLVSARQKYAEALQTRQKLGDPVIVANSQMRLASLALEAGHPSEAESSLRKAIPTFRDSKQYTDEISALGTLSRALLDEGKPDEADAALQQAEESTHKNADPAVNLPLAIQRARLRAASNRPPSTPHEAISSAISQLQRVTWTARKLGYFNIECDARLALGELAVRMKPSVGRTELSALAKEAHNRGFELISQKAAKMLGSPLQAPPKPNSSSKSQ